MKRICVLSDGTWNSPKISTPSNIVKLTKALLKKSDGIDQVKFYDPGLGTGAGTADQLLGGAFGVGIDINIKQLYTFLSLHYEEGDEIYMFGFSRGAYTVRSLAGFMYDCGLVRNENVENIDEAYELYRSNKTADHKDLVNFRKKYGDRVPIKLVACFDTVGSLGLPDNFGALSGLQRERYQFHDVKLSNIIENAIHMLSIEEDGSTFKPTPMEPNKDVENQLTQKYFWGRHGGIGGSEPTQIECGRITLRFLIDEIERRELDLGFNMDLIPQDPNPLAEDNFEGGGISAVLRFFLGSYFRKIKSVDQLDDTAIIRYQKVAPWRPKALEAISESILDY